MTFSGFKKALFTAVLIALPLCGLWHIGQGAYIQSRALLAQILLETAWADTLQGQKEVKPWPWADTWPVGRLSVPRLGLGRIVLAGASGEALAFGPGRLFQAGDRETSHTIIAGHRDTHFRFLQDISTGDRIDFETARGLQQFSVIDVRVLHENDILPESAHGPTLTLVTCYPFDAVRPGGPLRYAITATFRGQASRTAGI